MGELHEGKWHKRPYGWRADGVVETADRNVHVTIRKTNEEESGETVVMANGWTAGKNSMRVPAIVATQFGHRAVTVEYTNTGTADALASNVEDVVSVTEAEPDEYQRALMGLSMGGAVVTMAMSRVSVVRANIVNPGKYLLPRFYSVSRIGRQFLAEAGEIAQIGRNPLRAAAIGATSVGNCARRPGAVVAELRELLTGTVHDDFRQAKARPQPPFVRLVINSGDKLIPAYAQLASIEEAQLPYDHLMQRPGGHGRLAYDPSLAWEINALDAEQPLLIPPALPVKAAA